MEKPLKPGAHARREIIRRIIQGEWKPGANLPSERKLSEFLGVTRATLREVLKLMEKEGWITIKHGKPSCVKHFWDEGGLGILTGLNENKDLFPFSLILELLEVRAGILPICATKGFEKNPAEFRDIIDIAIPGEDSTPEEFTHFDWRLQERIIEIAENRVYKLVYNEFRPLFLFFGKEYFKMQEARTSSIEYYNQLKSTLIKNINPDSLIFNAMSDSILVWKKLNRE